MAAALGAVACGDDGGSPAVDARLPDAAIDAADCVPVDDSNPCTEDVCENNLPVNNPTPGAACPGGGTCDTAGACVVPSCTDSIMNGTETGVDCGGACAPALTCDTGIGCAIAADCTSGVCGTDLLCAAPACGDGVVHAGEMCDDGNMTNGDGCDDGPGGTCRPTGCGNGVVTGTEACDDGNAVNGDGCDNNCTVTGCGNGVTTTGETCDDGNTDVDDGCDDACAVETGFTCDTMVPSTCAAICGDGAVLGAETCDDGNTDPADGCDAACATEAGYACTGAPSVCATVCGDGMLTGLEVCDDGNAVSLDGCNATCSATDTPGTAELEPNEDGTPDPDGPIGISGNDFDTGGLAVANATAQGVILASGGDALRIGSLTPIGDEDVWAVRNDTPGYVTVRFDTWNRGAGFGVGVACAESIDTGLTLRDAVGASLQSNDDRSSAADRCSGLARVLAPGASVYAHIVEYSDDDAIEGYAFQVAFTPVPCGDGVLGGAACDDGNTADSDGCSANCTIEPNYVCAGAPSVCTAVICGDGIRVGPEACDDGNTADSDGCDATCAVEAGWGCTTASPSVCTLNPYTSIPLACVDMTAGTSLTLSDGDTAVSARAPLPFAFPLYGTTMTHFSASTNGFAGFFPSDAGTLDAATTNATAVPSASVPNGYLAPFWDDLDLTTIKTLTTGTSPNQVFSIEWNSRIWLVTASNIVFQLQINETGAIEYHYCTGAPGTSSTGPARISGSSATVAAENAAGTVGRAISINTANAITWGTTAYRWAIP